MLSKRWKELDLEQVRKDGFQCTTIKVHGQDIHPKWNEEGLYRCKSNFVTDILIRACGFSF